MTPIALHSNPFPSDHLGVSERGVIMVGGDGGGGRKRRRGGEKEGRMRGGGVEGEGKEEGKWMVDGMR